MGHLHRGIIKANTDDKGHQTVIANCGSTGVNKEEREDGIQNQYCMHVIDLNTNKFESIWRAYSPSIQTKYGSGGWTRDNSFEKNPTEFSLPVLNYKQTIDSRITKKQALRRKKIIEQKLPDTRFTIETEIAIANLLGAWNEKA
jgi:hypothetical protein